MTALALFALLLATPSAAEVPTPSVAEEARQILDQILAVDTSHGGETKVAALIKERFDRAGIASQILESAPGRGNLIARLKGSGAKRPLLLLAHLDVVPVEGQAWNTPPFQPTEQGGFLYARGVSDDKAMVAAIAAVALELQRSHAKLSRDLIIALTAGEETGGSAGARWLVEHHRELIDAELALNEGGALELDEQGQHVQQAGIQPAEKTFQTFRLSVRGKGGHSSVPPLDNPITTLARALIQVGELRLPARVLPLVKGMLASAAAHEQGALAQALRGAVASAPGLKPEDEAVLSKDRLYNAGIRTTCVATMLRGSPQDNVLPTVAEAEVNCRILPDESIDQTQAAITGAIGNPAVEITRTTDFGAGGESPLRPDLEAAVRAATTKIWGSGVTVLQTMSAGATDSRYLRQAGIAAYGIHVAPGTLDDQRKGFGAHGANERRAVKFLAGGVQYLELITLALAQ